MNKIISLSFNNMNYHSWTQVLLYEAPVASEHGYYYFVDIIGTVYQLPIINTVLEWEDFDINNKRNVPVKYYEFLNKNLKKDSNFEKNFLK
jgi:hypothetical protein